MPVAVKMPKLGMTMAEGTVARWLAAEGDRVAKGQAVVEIETDKIVNELEAPASGILARIVLQEQATAEVAQTLGWILLDGESLDDLPCDDGGEGAVAFKKVPSAQPSESPPPDAGGLPVRAERPIASPAARRVARQLGVDLHTITGSGPGGRIVKEDILKVGGQIVPSAAPDSSLEPLSPMRQAIVKHVTRSAAVPQIVLHFHADASALVNLHQENKTIAFDDAIAWCAARALGDHPYLNASFEPQGIRLHSQVNIGLVVAVERGLLIPVIRGADQLSLRRISAQRKRIVEQIRSRGITEQDTCDGTFTITNLGMYPVDRFTALLSPPQAAILSVGQIRLVAVPDDDGGVALGPAIEFGLTLDHRVADGATGAAFLKDFVTLIESVALEGAEHDG